MASLFLAGSDFQAGFAGGVELDPLYVAVIARRFEAATSNQAILVETGETLEAAARGTVRNPCVAPRGLQLRADVADEPSTNGRLLLVRRAADGTGRSEVRIPSAPPSSPGKRTGLPLPDTTFPGLTARGLATGLTNLEVGVQDGHSRVANRIESMAAIRSAQMIPATHAVHPHMSNTAPNTALPASPPAK